MKVVNSSIKINPDVFSDWTSGAPSTKEKSFWDAWNNDDQMNQILHAAATNPDVWRWMDPVIYSYCRHVSYRGFHDFRGIHGSLIYLDITHVMFISYLTVRGKATKEMNPKAYILKTMNNARNQFLENELSVFNCSASRVSAQTRVCIRKVRSGHRVETGNPGSDYCFNVTLAMAGNSQPINDVTTDETLPDPASAVAEGNLFTRCLGEETVEQFENPIMRIVLVLVYLSSYNDFVAFPINPRSALLSGVRQIAFRLFGVSNDLFGETLKSVNSLLGQMQDTASRTCL